MSNTASQRAAGSPQAPDASGTRPAVRVNNTSQALVGPTLGELFATWVAPHRDANAQPPLEERLSLVVDTLLALSQLHSNKGTPKPARRHGNLHPDTIVVGLTGVVNLLLEQKTNIKQARKWLGYQAPELLLRKYPASPATDIFAVGTLLYQCVTTRPMYPMHSAKKVFASIKERTHHTPEDLSPEEKRVFRVIEQATSYQPRARYRSAQHMLQALLDALGYMPQERIQVAARACQHASLTVSMVGSGKNPARPTEPVVNLRKPTFPKAPSLPSFGIHALQPAVVAPKIDSVPPRAGPESITGPRPTPVEHIEQLTDDDRMPAERPSNRPTAAAPPLSEGRERIRSETPNDLKRTRACSTAALLASTEVTGETTEYLFPLSRPIGHSDSDPTTLYRHASRLGHASRTQSHQSSALLNHLHAPRRPSQPIPRVLSVQKTQQPTRKNVQAVTGFLKGAAAVFAIAASLYLLF